MYFSHNFVVFSYKIKHHIRNTSWDFFRKIKCNRFRKRLKNPGVTIISVNCVGGILYHDLGLPFLSPTINLFMKSAEFIKFCENIDYYLNIDKFEECLDPDIKEDRKYPVALLGDLYLYLVHYNNIKEAQEKWDRRKARVNINNIVILASDREGMNQNLVDRFEKLPYKKVLFTNLPNKYKGNNLFYIKGYENASHVGIITEKTGWGGRRPIDQFDWVSFLNRSS